jgi:hypothetical protein
MKGLSSACVLMLGDDLVQDGKVSSVFRAIPDPQRQTWHRRMVPYGDNALLTQSRPASRSSRCGREG